MRTFPLLVALVALVAPSPSARGADTIDWGYCASTPPPQGWHLEDVRPQAVTAAAALPLPVAPRDASDLAFLKVTIRDAEGAALPGALDAYGGRILWRGASPWIPGATYHCTIETDNSGLVAARYPGAPASADWRITWDFTAVDGPATVVPLEAIEVTAAYRRVELVSAGPWVCCDGAFPTLGDHGHSICDVETCGSLLARGEIVVDAGFAASAAPAAVANSAVLLRGPREEGEAWCVNVEVHDITASSLAAAGTRCVPRPPGPLGLLDHDPSARLEQICEGERYTCRWFDESDLGAAWNPDECSPWTSSGSVTAGDDAAEAAGCACRGGGPHDESLVGFGLFVALVRRRRPRCVQ